MAGAVEIDRASTPDGRVVVLDSVAWGHVLDRHPAMIDHLDLVLETVRCPELERPDPRAGRVRHTARGGPQRWLTVVLQFAGDHDRVVTAIPHADAPVSQ